MITMTDYEELADFCITHSDGHFGNIHRQIIIDTCRNFDEVGQLIVKRDHGEIVAALYFDWLPNSTVDVKELVIHRDHRNIRTLKLIILKGWSTYPQAKFIRMSRRKYHDRVSTYKIAQFFKGDLNGRN